jgi:hypothetical protein
MAFKKGKSGNPTGRPKGTPNKISGELRDSMAEFLQGEFEDLKSKIKRMNIGDRMKFFVDVLPYVVPKLQSTSLSMSIERLPDDQLDSLIEQLKTEALKSTKIEIE